MRNRKALVPSAALTVGTLAVLRRMEEQYARLDDLTPPTVTAMYGLYGAYTVALGWACRRGVWPMALPGPAARRTGGALVVFGAATALAGVRRFDTVAQVSGTASESLHTTGIYRYSRNPQYLGVQLATFGAALASRSGLAALLALQVGAAYRRWIPSEERHLTRVFGTSYQHYAARTGRFVPRKRRRTT